MHRSASNFAKGKCQKMSLTLAQSKALNLREHASNDTMREAIARHAARRTRSAGYAS